MPGGRKAKAKKSTQIRVADDLAAMCRVLKLVDGVDNPDRLDPILRPVITEQFMALPKAIRDRVRLGGKGTRLSGRQL